MKNDLIIDEQHFIRDMLERETKESNERAKLEYKRHLVMYTCLLIAVYFLCNALIVVFS